MSALFDSLRTMQRNPTGRALQLLTLLQTHRQWGAAALAGRLEVTERTVRRDIDRLRDLGYPIDATRGRHGGYRLTAGARVPPLVFNDDEAVAVAVGLRAAAGAAISGMEDTSLQALAKVEQVLPHRLRRRVSALNASVMALRRAPPDDEIVDPDALSVLASACRDHEAVRFHYGDRDGTESRRLVEPHQLVTAGHRWYLVAWDCHRNDWRTFRLDRLRDAKRAGRPFAPHDIPGGDGAAYLAASLSSLHHELDALVVVLAPYEHVAATSRWFDHTAIDTSDDSCTIRIRADTLDSLVMAIVRLALVAGVHVLEPDAVATEVEALIGRLDDW